MNHRLDICLIGAQKAGTSSLAAWCGQTPGVCHSKVKEPHFWREPRSATEIATYFRTQFPDASGAPRLMESSTSYSMHPEYPRVARRLHEHNQDLRILYLVRDPVERIESHLVHRYMNGRIPDLELATVRSDPAYLDRSSYWLQLQQYLEHFDPEQIRVVVFEELIAATAAELVGLAEWLDLPTPVGLTLPVVNAASNRSGTTALEVAISRLGLRTPDRVRQRLRRRHGRSKPGHVLQDNERAELRADLSEEVGQLELFLGRPLAWVGYGSR